MKKCDRMWTRPEMMEWKYCDQGMRKRRRKSKRQWTKIEEGMESPKRKTSVRTVHSSSSSKAMSHYYYSCKYYYHETMVGMVVIRSLYHPTFNLFEIFHFLRNNDTSHFFMKTFFLSSFNLLGWFAGSEFPSHKYRTKRNLLKSMVSSNE